MNRLVTGDEAEVATCQHTSPCADCPWSRKSLNGWLGSMTADEWIQAAHGESMIECHTKLGAQCAGSAIYRRNLAKLCRSAEILRLAADREKVFSSPMEFKAHHSKRPSKK
jgi:hypothetical protein